MTTLLGLVAIVALLTFGGVFALRGSGGRRSRGALGLVGMALIAGAVVFLAWLAIMVIFVGPSMRAM